MKKQEFKQLLKLRSINIFLTGCCFAMGLIYLTLALALGYLLFIIIASVMVGVSILFISWNNNRNKLFVKWVYEND